MMDGWRMDDFDFTELCTYQRVPVLFTLDVPTRYL